VGFFCAINFFNSEIIRNFVLLITTTMNTITKHNTKVRNYQGQNSFITKMKEVVNKWGGLTERQAMAVEKAFAEPAKKVELQFLPERIKTIVQYKGENTFVMDIKAKFEKWGTLTDAQINAANKAIVREEEAKQRMDVNIDVIGETIVVGRNTGETLKKQKGLQFNPMLLDITEVVTLTAKAVKFKGKLTTKNCGVCKSCGRTLTDEFSRLTGYGKTCAKHMGVEYIKDKSEVERFNKDVLAKIEEIGEMEFWVPRRQIKVWNGDSAILLKF
jgi:hypothetical protein